MTEKYLLGAMNKFADFQNCFNSLTSIIFHAPAEGLVNIYIYTHTYIYIYTYLNIYVHTHTHMHAHTHTHTHIYIGVYIYIDISAQSARVREYAKCISAEERNRPQRVSCI